MPQVKVDTGPFEVKALREAARKCSDIVEGKGTYEVYYSLFTHRAEIVAAGEEHDPDWIKCEKSTPYAMSQQALADCITTKLEKLQRLKEFRDGLQKIIDGK